MAEAQKMTGSIGIAKDQRKRESWYMTAQTCKRLPFKERPDEHRMQLGGWGPFLCGEWRVGLGLGEVSVDIHQ